MVHWLIKQTFDMETEKVYVGLNASLTQRGSKIIFEESPSHIVAKQGSLWGMSPFTAKKTLDITLERNNNGTQVTCSSKISSDWRNVTIVGCILAGILVGVCLWMTVDLNAFAITGKADYWSWLATVDGALDASAAQSLIKLTEALAAFLSLVIVLEAVITAYVYLGIDKFAQEILNVLKTSGAVSRHER